MKMTNWAKVIDAGTSSREVLGEFAVGKLSKNETLSLLAVSEVSTELRNLVRQVGTKRARTLARKALRRRGYNHF